MNTMLIAYGVSDMTQIESNLNESSTLTNSFQTCCLVLYTYSFHFYSLQGCGQNVQHCWLNIIVSTNDFVVLV